MKINNLNLLYFRNYDHLYIEFHPKLNILVGENANGKTNIIESIFLLALGKSFRTKRDSECIKFNQEVTCMSCVIEKNCSEKDIMLAINNKGKNAKISGIKKNKLTDFVGELNVVLFSPEDLQLVKGAPALRREFIDREFYQISKKYHRCSLMYKHLLKQRNSLLKDIRKNRDDELSIIYLETLTSQLAKLAVYLTRERVNFVNKISIFAEKNMLDISDGKEKLKIVYKSSLLESMNLESTDNSDFNENNISSIIMSRSKEDIYNGNTKIGPHQDDLIFFINDVEARQFASQGQQRSIVLSLRLAEIYFLKEYTGEYPILLLDDVLSELDSFRQNKLLDSINENIQTFITTPDIKEIKENLLKHSKVFYIKNGIITENN